IAILRDASAASIYGSRAASGVILITTKNGSENESGISYSARYGLQQLSQFLNLLNGEGYMRAVNRDLEARGGAKMYSEEQIAQVGKGTDWQRETFAKSALIQNHQLSISGKTEKSNHFLGLN